MLSSLVFEEKPSVEILIVAVIFLCILFTFLPYFNFYSLGRLRHATVTSTISSLKKKEVNLPQNGRCFTDLDHHTAETRDQVPAVFRPKTSALEER